MEQPVVHGRRFFSRESFGIIRFRGIPSRNGPRTPISRMPRLHHHHSDFHHITLSVLYNVCWSVVVEPINPRRSSCRRCT
uniref:Uncharacterized protein n=1 Tax=Brassica campestris TaxID=3711 RepID=A0A3P6BMD9_BRACM|nr:unnamed protein product [Brassica rapa]